MGGAGASRRAATNLDLWGGPWGQSCSRCVSHPVHPRQYAVQATAANAAWATKGMAARVQVSRWEGT